MGKLNKKDWVCTQPFEFAEIFDHKTYMCCPQWLPEDLGDPNIISTNWNGEKANNIRESILDGSYKYCIESRCPKLTGLKNGNSYGFISKKEYDEIKDKYKTFLPTRLKFNFDQSCNLRCPSCRTMFINYEGKERERTEELIKNIEQQLSKGLTHIECTGSGDPFFSRTFRKWMMRLDPKLYPNLGSIHLHTNATLWNKSNWDRMKNVHNFVKSCEISIDAATKDTYENKTRIGGDWDKLNENLNFIKDLPNIEFITLSFVVQNDNLDELVDFYYFGEKLLKDSGKEWMIFYNRVVNWGTFSQEKFDEVDVGNPNHPRYPILVENYNKLPKSKHLRHNLSL